MLQYVTIPITDLGAGIDQLSAENQIPDGFSEDLLNADPRPEGYLSKRVGYQGYAGNMPLRVERVEYRDTATNNICLFFDGTVDLSRIPSGPLVVYGRTSADNASNVGDFPNDADAALYYSSFTTETRRTFAAGSNSIAIDSDEHGIAQPFIWVGATAATGTTDNSNSIFYPDSVSINQGTDAITVSYNNGGAAFEGFLYFASKATTAGSTYISGATTLGTGTSTTSITSGTHGLSNSNILARCFVDDGSTLVEIQPESVTIATNGTVAITVDNNTGASIDVRFVLSVTPVANIKAGSAAAGATVEVTITDLTSDFIFAGCYLEQTIGGTKELVIPESIVVDSSSATATVTFVNGSADAANFFIYWEEASLTVNSLTVSGSTIGTGFTDDEPQLTVWGLDHGSIYPGAGSDSRAGWATFLDSYRSAGENRLISGLGGNLFGAYSRAEVGDTYLLPQLYPNIRARVGASATVGPAFGTVGRTRGYLSFSGDAEGWAKGTAVTWDSSTGWVKYTLNCPSLAVNGTLSTIISTTAGLEDQLTVEQAGLSINNGTFTIKQLQQSGDLLYIWVDNPDVDSSDGDETDCWMNVGVFTDRLTLNSTSPFIPGDLLLSDLFEDSYAYTAVASSTTTLLFSGATEPLDVPAGLQLGAERTGRVIPLRNSAGTALSTNLVAGDNLVYGELARELRAVSVNSSADVSVTIDGDGETATVTLGSGTTSRFRVGQWILLKQAGVYSGEQQITAIPSSTKLEFESTEDATAIAGTLCGHAVEVDEELTFEDPQLGDVTLTVPQRWIPIEAPDTDGNLPRQTYYRHFDALDTDEQLYLRSVMSAGNLYLSNGTDEVWKFDGANLYRAGLSRWQPQLFVVKDTTPATGGEIEIEAITVSVDSWTGNRFTLTTTTDVENLAAGDRISNSVDDAIYTVLRTANDGTDSYVYVDRSISGASGTETLSKISTFSYYFKLSLVDANNNIVNSAIVGSEDTRVELSESAQVRLRLVGLPPFGAYDCNRIEVEVYRTKANSLAPYYRLTNIPLSFDRSQGYLDFIDAESDDTLSDLDTTSTALLGAELGTQWSEPLRAKYITSAGGRLVLANIRSYPQLDIRLVDTGSRITAATLDTKVFTFRKDSTDTGTSTNNTDRMRFEFLDSGAVTIDPSADIANNSGASFTITENSHGLVAGNWVYLFHSAVTDGDELTYSGWWQVASADTNTFTITFAHSSAYTPGAADVDRYLTASTKTDIPVWLGTDGNYGMRGANPSTSGAYEQAAMRRLANAINSAQRQCTTTGFEPWLSAGGGDDFQLGQLVVTTPTVLATTPEILLPTFSGYEVFINNTRRSSGAQVSASTLLFPSRLLVSGQNFAEIFDNPLAALDSESPSAIDVNPDDGQQIMGVLPFFGESAFGASQQSGVLAVFKESSIYLVDLNAKAAGQPCIQRIDSQGIGCTAPFSIAPVRGGIAFANASGIYRLTRGLTVEYFGRRLERYWKETVNRDNLDLMTGHHFNSGNQYKLSLPVDDGEANSEVAVYNETREYTPDGQAMGSWTRYDNHPATAWCNLDADAFFASTGGRIFSIRRTGEASDYRDDASAVAMVATLRAMDFGDASLRKAIQGVTLAFRAPVSTTGTVLYSAANMEDDWQEADSFELVGTGRRITGLSDGPSQKVQTLRFSVGRRRLQYVQLKVENSALDEPVEVVGITLRIAGLSSEGTKEAYESTASP
jgi:hypothetical protein